MADLAMGWDEWAAHDATALAARIRRREVTPTEAAAQAAAAIAMLDGRLGAILEVFADVVANPDADGPDPAGPLYGVPMVLKDLGSTLKGRRQDSGSALFSGSVARATDPTIANHLANGLVPIARATTPEFGMTFDTATDYLGEVKVTRNPWNPARTPGGSSGGSAVAVATAMVPVGMSGDGGGSTRIPASFCGLIGLKATRGRVPRPLGQSEYQVRFSAEGVLTRTVRDTAAVYERLTRVPGGGTFMPLAPAPSYLAAIAVPPGRRRISSSVGGREAVTPLPTWRSPPASARRALEAPGHHVEEVSDAAICDWAAMWRGYVTIDHGHRPVAGRRRRAGDEPRQPAGAARADDLPPPGGVAEDGQVRRLAQHGGQQRGRAQLRRLHGGLGRAADPDAGDPSARGQRPLFAAARRGTHPLGQPARRRLPLYHARQRIGPARHLHSRRADPDGLPIGAQLYGNFNAEPLLLQLAAQMEAAHPGWFNQRPPLHVAG